MWFAKGISQKATINFLIFLQQPGTEQFLPDRCLWNLLFRWFTKICQNVQILVKGKGKGYPRTGHEGPDLEGAKV
jgi:hypothetical protein